MFVQKGDELDGEALGDYTFLYLRVYEFFGLFDVDVRGFGINRGKYRTPIRLSWNFIQKISEFIVEGANPVHIEHSFSLSISRIKFTAFEPFFLEFSSPQ